jgi:2-dehydro-3-deoxyphosphogluconate aldolase / (4S)-4-hydroxy-2-oxoglutarate aldolase
MDKQQSLEIVMQSRMVAIVRLDDLSCAEQLVRALLDGGIRAIEFTLTNTDTPQVVADLLGLFPQFSDGQATLGIGSVRTSQEAQLAIGCGAQFIVSPISKEAIIRQSVEAGVACFPGAFSPTEIAQAAEWGADIVKVFPARALGPGYIRDVLAPMPYLKLMPTGGVDLNNLAAYMAAGAVAVGIGGQLLEPQWIKQSDWGNISKAASQYSQAARSK